MLLRKHKAAVIMLRKVCAPLTRPIVRQHQSRYWYSTIASQKSENSEAVPDNVNDLSKPVHVRIQKRSPFMKSMFLGTVDSELLIFPESLNREEQNRLLEHAEQVKEAVKQTEADISSTTLKLLGLQGPLEYAGKQFTETELAYVCELMAEDRARALVTLEHNAILNILSRHGSDELKEKFLGKLCSGEVIAATALYEISSSRHTMFNTVANLDFTNRKWVLNGSKVFIRNNTSNPDLLLVVASTKNKSQLNKEDGTVAVFLVDAQEKGVKMSHGDIGSKGLSRMTVNFNHVEVPESNLVGTESGGAEILTKYLSAGRVQSSVVRVALLKKVLNALTDFCINTKTSTGELMDIEIVREQLARMASVIYATESMIYMTASLMDDFDDQDVEMEAAITKVFSAENLLKYATLPLQLLGTQALAPESTFESLFDDALKLFIGDESLDSVNFFIALTGLQYAGMHSYETIKKDRNPAMYPSHVLSKLFEKTSIENPKKFANLQQFFHPSLDPAAHWIEFSVVRLKLATECVLSRHGIEIVDRHIELGRLANIAALIYAMTASASRASRSYCIGLRHAAHEVHLANMFCRESSEKVRMLAIELEKGPYITSDDDYNVIARNLFREKRYFFEHPVTKNF